MNHSSFSAWVLFKNPREALGLFVLRHFEVINGAIQPSRVPLQASSPEPLRKQMREQGLNCMPRNPQDDPCIVETWI